MKPFSSLKISLGYPSCFLVNSRGYLLAEVMIAVAIFSIGFAAVGSLILTTTANNRNGNILTQATLLAVETIEHLKEEAVQNIAIGEYSDANNPVDERGDSGGIFHRSWVVDDPIGYDTARRVRVTVRWHRLGSHRAIEMTSITRGDGT